MGNERIFKMSFADVYPMYLAKAEKKGRTKSEVDEIIYWLTGYNEAGLKRVLEKGESFLEFFEAAPAFNPNASLIKGSICGYRVEEIQDTLLQKIRYLDLMVDELSKGKTMEKIFRK